MTDLRNRLQGLWLPLVTPFRDGALDELSLRRLVRHYASGPVDGFILAATSGEGLTLEFDELEHLVAAVRAELAMLPRIMPVCLGLAGAATHKMQEMLDETAAWPIDGYLISAPYYLRPSHAACSRISVRSPITRHGRSCSTTSLIEPRSTSPTRRCCVLPSIRTLSV
jgi:4-hydroxy-tetrahydrodipicolinate synthase